MDIERDTYEVDHEELDEVRLYWDAETDGPKLSSVTTILKTRNEDKGNLYDWQDRNNGEGDAAHHEHLFWYSRHIGTLGHWHALRQLDEDLDWSPDEAKSRWALANVQTIDDDSDYTFYDERLDETVTLDGSNHEEIWDVGPREVLYSILRGDKNKGGGTVATWGEFYDKYPPYRTHEFYADALVGRAESDVTFFVDAQQRLWRKLGVDSESVIAVEKFLFIEQYGYAGQVDLVYEDGDTVVVADLKSSSGCYDKHQIQGAAYGKAIEVTDDIEVESVDRLEVHRAHPRTGQMAVHTHKDAPNKQPVHTTKYWNESYDDLWERFHGLVEDFEYVDEGNE